MVGHEKNAAGGGLAHRDPDLEPGREDVLDADAGLEPGLEPGL